MLTYNEISDAVEKLLKNASGSSKIYLHNIIAQAEDIDDNEEEIAIQIISSKNERFTLSQLNAMLDQYNNLGQENPLTQFFRVLQATAGNTTYSPIVGSPDGLIYYKWNATPMEAYNLEVLEFSDILTYSISEI